MPLSIKPILGAAMFLAAAALSSLPVAAQDDGAVVVFGAWQILCEPLPEGGEQCALTQHVIDEDLEQVWLQAFVFASPDAEGAIRLSVLVPLRVILTEGLGLRIGETVNLRLEFVTCSTDGCLVSADLTAPLLAALAEADEALFVFHFEDDVGIGVPISLEGFADGIAELR